MNSEYLRDHVSFSTPITMFLVQAKGFASNVEEKVNSAASFAKISLTASFETATKELPTLPSKVKELPTLAKTKSGEFYLSSVNGLQRQKARSTSYCYNQAKKVADLVHQKRDLLLFCGITALTAYLSPGLLVLGTVIGVAARVKGTDLVERYVRRNFNHAENARLRPSNLDAPFVGVCGLTLASIAAVDALALSTIFTTSLTTVTFLPMVGGLVLGNAIGQKITDRRV